MNKQELIKKYKRLEGVWDAPGAETARQIFLQDLDQLDQPEKVKVPQFVANYIEYAKNTDWDLQDLFKLIDDEDSEELQRWFYHECNQETLAHAWIFGYEVEKEPKYTVKIKATKHYFAKDGNGRIYFSLKYESAFTKIELEKTNLGWVFDCEGIEIKEVE